MLIGVFLVISIVFLVVENTKFYEYLIVGALVLSFVRIAFARRKMILNMQEAQTLIFDKTLAIDKDKGIYIVQDNPVLSLVLTIIFGIITFIFFNWPGDLIYYYLVMVIIFLNFSSNLVKIFNKNYLKKNKLILADKNFRFKVMELAEVEQTDSGAFIFSFGNGIKQEMRLSKHYDNYDRLVSLLSQS